MNIVSFRPQGSRPLVLSSIFRALSNFWALVSLVSCPVIETKFTFSCFLLTIQWFYCYSSPFCIWWSQWSGIVFLVRYTANICIRNGTKFAIFGALMLFSKNSIENNEKSLSLKMILYHLFNSVINSLLNYLTHF